MSLKQSLASGHFDIICASRGILDELIVRAVPSLIGDLLSGNHDFDRSREGNICVRYRKVSAISMAKGIRRRDRELCLRRKDGEREVRGAEARFSSIIATRLNCGGRSTG